MMRRIPFMILSFMIFLCADLHAQSTGYVAIPDPAQTGYIYRLHSVSANHYISVGTSGSGYSQHEVIYWDQNFQPVWVKYFPSAVVLNWIDIIETNDGKFVAFGANQDNNGDNIAIKFDVNGNILWMKEYYISGTFLTSFCVSKAAGNDPGFVFGGGACAASAFLVRCDANGTIVWQHEYYITGSAGVETTDCVVAENNGYVLAGNLLMGSSNDAFLTRIDSAGNWITSVYASEPTLHQIPSRMIKLSTGNYAVVCGYNSNPNYCQMIYYFNSSCSPMSGVKYTEPLSNEIYFYDMIEVSNGSTILVGALNDAPSPMKYIYTELDATGTPVWVKKATGVNTGYMNGTAYGITNAPGGNFAVGGGSYEDGRSVAVIDATGAGYCNGVTAGLSTSPADAFTPISVTPIIIPPNILEMNFSATASTLTLTPSTLCGGVGMEEPGQNGAGIDVYPIPSNTTIHLSIGARSILEGKFTLYDPEGRMIATGKMTDGIIDVSSLSPGMYTLKVEENDVISMCKVLIN